MAQSMIEIFESKMEKIITSKIEKQSKSEKNIKSVPPTKVKKVSFYQKTPQKQLKRSAL